MARSLLVVPLLAVLALPAWAQSPAPTPTPTPVPRLSTAECEVWARELSFARSVAEHDAVAFAAHLEPETAFGVGQAEPKRGREAVVTSWAGIIQGKGLKLSWYPTRTTIAGASPGVAWSTGPALFESTDPKASPRYRLSTYQSVWQRGQDGVWRVLFDGGTPPAVATEADVAAFHAGRREQCPQA